MLRSVLFVIPLLAAGIGCGDAFEDAVEQPPVPLHVAVAPDGAVYVSGSDGFIRKFSLDGVVLAEMGGPCELFSKRGCLDPDGDGPLKLGDGQFNGFWGMEIDSKGNLFVADAGNHRVQMLDSDGTFLRSWGFTYPLAMAIDKEDNLFVADTQQRTISKIDSTGAVREIWGFDERWILPYDMTVDGDGHLIITFSSVYLPSYLIQRLNSHRNGEIMGEWGVPRESPAEEHYTLGTGAYGVAVDPRDGAMYVANFDKGSLLKYAYTDSSGAAPDLVDVWEGTEWDGLGYSCPRNVAVDAEGMVYVTDICRDKIFKLNDAGEVLGVWGLREEEGKPGKGLLGP